MTTQFIGYARVSTLDQTTTVQREQLEAAGCNRIYEENASGTSRKGRTELATVLDMVRKGDTIVVTRVDRLARSLKDLQDIVHDLKERGVHLKATEQPIDTSTPAGKAFLDMLGVFAEFETNLRRERQLEGIAKAKAKGVYKGGAKLSDTKKAEISKLSGESIGATEISRRLGVARATVYNVLKADKPPA